MKKIYILFIVTAAIITGCQEQCNRGEEISNIQLVLEKHIIANETKNIDLIKEIWAPKEDIVIYGTDSDEKLQGWTQIRSTFLQQFEMFEEAYSRLPTKKSISTAMATRLGFHRL